MTPADQPTTEPSVLDEALAALRGYFGLRLPIEGGVLVPVAHLHALYEALAPAPAVADTEVQ